MEPLLWVMLPWLLQVTPAAVGELPPPAGLSLNSSSFSHVLSWQPGAGTPAGVYYSVSMMTERGISWSPVAGCEHVQHPLVCSLTKAIHNPRELHFVQVEAKLAALTSRPAVHPGFIPLSDAHLDLPVLTVTSCGVDLCVDLHPPVEDQRQHYDLLHYRLKVENGRADTAMVRDVRSLTPQVLRGLAPGRRYCVSVSIYDFLVYRESDYSRPVCVVTPHLHTAHHWILPVSFLMVLLLVLLMVLFKCGFLCLRRAPPLVLSSICHMEVLVLSPRSLSLVPLVVLKPSSPTPSEHVRKCSSDDSDSETESLSRSRTYKDGLNSSRPSSWSCSVSGPRSPSPSNQSPPSQQTQPRTEVQSTVTTHSGLDFMDTHSSNVDLLTLTCASHRYQEEEEDGEEEGEEEGEELHPHLTNDRSTSGCFTNSASFQRPEMWDVGQKTVFFSGAEGVQGEEHGGEEVEEEEEEGEESSGYLGRPPDAFKHFKS